MVKHPLHKAITNNDLKTIEEILSKGYNINSLDDQERTPLYFAFQVKSQESALLLIKLGAKYFKGKSNSSKRVYMLHAAAKTGVELVVEWLLENGSDANERNRFEEIPLHLAATGAVADTLLELGEAEVDAKCDYGTRPLHRAVNLNRLDVVQSLLKHGADVNATNNDGDAPLHIAVMEAVETKNLEILKTLIDNGANLNAKAKHGTTALHSLDGMRAGDLKVAREILKHDVDIDARDNQGHTPLNLALKSSLIKLYLKKGADINILSRYGSTPLEICYNDLKFSRENGSSQAEIRDFVVALEGLVKHISKLKDDGAHVSDRNLKLLDEILKRPDILTIQL